MELARRNRTAAPLGQLRDEMGDLVGRFFEGWPFGNELGGAWVPALDVAEHEKEYVVHTELPGIKPEEVEIAVLDNVLTISGEKKEETETSGRTWQHVERRYGSFRRSIQLPAGVEPEKVSADYRDGVLRISLPKSEKALPRRITVKAAKG